jgi:hypothetical protein
MSVGNQAGPVPLAGRAQPAHTTLSTGCARFGTARIGSARDCEVGRMGGGKRVRSPTRLARPAPPILPDAAGRRTHGPRARPVELAAMGSLVLLAVAVIALQHEVLGRQFWGDESWRAYHISLTDGFWRKLKGADAPFPLLWLLIERAAIRVGGNNLLSLRLPVVAAFVALGPLTYVVGRRWLSVPASLATAGLLLLNGPVFAYAVQLKPFPVDCAASLAALWLWLLGRERSLRPSARRLLYLGIAVCGLLAVAAVFVVGFVLLLDLIELARRRAWSRLGPPLAAGAASLAHLGLFVLPQSSVTANVDWRDFYPPHAATGAVAFVAKQLAGFFPGMVTQLPRYVPVPVEPRLQLLPGVWTLLALLLLAALIAGVVAGVTGRRGAVLAGVLGWCLGVELIASALHLWPFGFARANYFLLPFAYLLAGVGVAWLVERARRQGRRLLAGGLAVATLVGCAGLLVAGQAQLARARQTAHGPVYELHTADAVAWARLRSGPDDVVVFPDQRYLKGWAYYLRFYQGYDPVVAARPRPRIVQVAGPAREAALRDLLAGDPGAANVFVVLPINVRPERVAAVTSVLAGSGFHQAAVARFPLSASVRRFSR